MTDQQSGGGVLRWIAGMLVPMFARPIRPVSLAWLLHIVLLLAVLVGAFFLQRHTDLRDWLGRAPDFFRPFWLPALFLLGYALLWAAAWLWAQLVPEQATIVYPDLDEAWDAILESLQRAGIGIADTPVFVVIGELPAGFEPLFRALPRGVTVAGGTPSESAVRVFANSDAIYVTLSGATLLGVQEAGDIVDLTSTAGTDGGGQSVGGAASIGIGQSVGFGGGGESIGGGGSISGSLGASMAGGSALRKIQRIIQKAKQEGRDLSDDEKDQIRELSVQSAQTPVAPTPQRKAAPLSVLQNPELVGEAEARLSYICQRIAACRWPLCPINGLILAVPVSALENENRAVQWGAVARQDLSVIENTLKLQFPVFALLGGVELLPGGAAFFDLFAAEKGNQRLGKGFPLNPSGGPAEVGDAIASTAGWVLGGLLPYWALRYTRVTGQPTDTDDNAGAVRFIEAIGRRGPPFGRLLTQAIMGDRPPTFGGCYLVVGSVRDPNEAKFARDFFKKVEGAQAAVAWTDDAYAADASYRRWTLTGYVTLGAIVVGVIGLAVYVFGTKSFK